MNQELKRMHNKVIITYFNVLLQLLQHKQKTRQDGWLDLNYTHPVHRGGAL